MLFIFFWKVMSWILLLHLFLMSQDYTQRNKQYHSIWKIFTILGTKINNFVNSQLKKTAHVQLGYYTRKPQKTW